MSALARLETKVEENSKKYEEAASGVLDELRAVRQAISVAGEQAKEHHQRNGENLNRLCDQNLKLADRMIETVTRLASD